MGKMHFQPLGWKETQVAAAKMSNDESESLFGPGGLRVASDRASPIDRGK
jgi:hypothetical protein